MLHYQLLAKRTYEEMLYIVYLYIASRPVTTASGRHVRLGTASMLSEPDGPFVDLSKLNIQKYSQKPALAKVRTHHGWLEAHWSLLLAPLQIAYSLVTYRLSNTSRDHTLLGNLCNLLLFLLFLLYMWPNSDSPFGAYPARFCTHS